MKDKYLLVIIYVLVMQFLLVCGDLVCVFIKLEVGNEFGYGYDLEWIYFWDFCN